MRKAYIILAHKNQQQLERLIKRLDDGSSEFFIHLDMNCKMDKEQIISNTNTCISMIPGLKTKWGSFELVQATLNSLKMINTNPKDFERIVLLSGQDYPIKTNQEIDSFFKGSRYQVFIDHSSFPNYKKWEDGGGMYRVTKYYWGLSYFHKYAAKAANFLSLHISAFNRRLKKKMCHFHGSQWWTIDNYALQYILKFVSVNPDYIAFHKNTFAPDELFFQTILLNATDTRIKASILNNNQVFMKWAHPAIAHPETLLTSDFNDIMQSPALFARKFDTSVDAEILDRIDYQLTLRNTA